MTDYKLEIEELFLPYLRGHKVLTVTFSGELGDDTKVFQLSYSTFEKALTHLIETEKKKARIDELIHLKKELYPLSRDDHYTYLLDRIKELEQ